MSAMRALYTQQKRTIYKVALIGSYGGIGQPLSLLLKNHPRISQLNIFDLNPATPGQGADLSHIPNNCQVTAFSGNDLGKCVAGVDMIVIPAGVPRKPGMTRDDLFNTNASIVANIAKAAAENAPKAAHLIISNPVNSTVPIYAEILKRYGTYNPDLLFGVTTLDVIRAQTFLMGHGKKTQAPNVPVIGGHAGITIIPVFSAVADITMTNEERDKLTHRVMFGGDEVVQAKGGAGSATLSMAVAAALFANNVIRGFDGENVIDYTYVSNNVVPDVPYFAGPVQLGKTGIVKRLPLPTLNSFEQEKLQAAIPELKSSIKKGIDFAAAWQPK